MSLVGAIPKGERKNGAKMATRHTMLRRGLIVLVLVVFLSGAGLAQKESGPWLMPSATEATEGLKEAPPTVPPPETKPAELPTEVKHAEPVEPAATDAESMEADGPAGWEKRGEQDFHKGSITIDNLPQVPPDLDKWHPMLWNSIYGKVGGFVQVDLIGDTAPIINQFSFTPSQIPFNDDYTLQNSGFISLGPSFRLAGRRTRFSGQLYSPHPKFLRGTRVSVEMDFSGKEGAPNLRHAFVAWPNLIIGRTDSVFKDADAEPETVDPAGPNALFGTRQQGIRVVFPFKDYNIAISGENSGGIITPTGVQVTNERLKNNLDYGMHLRANKEWGHLQLSGILRDLQTEDFPGRKQRFSGYGVSLSGRVFAGDLNNHQFALTYGNGLGSLVSDLAGTNSELGLNTQGVVDTQKSLSGYLAHQHWWDEKSRSTFYASYVDVDLRDGQPTDSYQRGAKLGFNYVRSPSKRFTWGAEFVWGIAEIFSGQTKTAGRMQGMVRYKF
jgi:hypothetical protein